MNNFIYHTLAKKLLKALMSLIVLVNLQVKLKAHLAFGLYLGCVHHFDELSDSFFTLFENEVISDDTPVVVLFIGEVHAVEQGGVCTEGSLN